MPSLVAMTFRIDPEDLNEDEFDPTSPELLDDLADADD